MNSLTTRRLELERMTDIPDMPAYSQKWRELAADFRACGYLSNAALCDSKAQHYAGMSGHYTRVISSPVVILEAVA